MQARRGRSWRGGTGATPIPRRPKRLLPAGTSTRLPPTRKPRRAALDGATPLSKNAYKLPLFETLVRRAILKAVA